MEKITIDQVSTRIASGTLAFLLFFQSVYPVNAGVVVFQAPRVQFTYSPVDKEINNTQGKGCPLCTCTCPCSIPPEKYSRIN